MFIGHFGLAFATKKSSPKLSLGTTFLAAQFYRLWPYHIIRTKHDALVESCIHQAFQVKIKLFLRDHVTESTQVKDNIKQKAVKLTALLF